MPSRNSDHAALPAPRLKPPAALVDFQRWFGAASSRPLRASQATRVRDVDGSRLTHAANARLKSVNGLDGRARLEVYNRQYWFRLVGIMQEEYPCAVHLLGLDAFNAWVVRYLMAYPPASPYLADLDAGFPAFVGRRVRASHGVTAPAALRGAPWRTAVREALAYDKALSRALDAPDGADGPGFTPGPTGAGMAVTLQDGVPSGAASGSHVSPLLEEDATGGAVASARWGRVAHVTPLWLHWDFGAYRTLCRADEKLTDSLPLKRQGGRSGQGVCLYRHEGAVYEKPVSRAEFLLLDALGTPRTLDRIFRAAARAATPRDLKAMERHVSTWFQDWTERGWIAGKGS